MRKSVLFGFGLVVTALVALGLVILSSASQVNGLRLYHDAYHFMKQQFTFVGCGIALACFAAWFDYRQWRDHPSLAWAALVVVAVLLLAVFAFPKVNGSYRWIRLGGLRLQPSEFAKVVTVIVVSVWLDRAGYRVEQFVRGALVPALFIGAMALPILKEPDFGSVMVVALSGFLVMFVVGVRVLHLLPFALCGLVLFAWKVAGNLNRMTRLVAWLGVSPESVGVEVADAAADNAAYQGKNALIAIQNGGLWGVGLGQSMQKHMYLPESHTDMIFAVGAEELGLLFSVGTVLLFLAFFGFSVYIARNAADRFGRYLAVGMAFIVFFSAMFNVGVVCGALPMKGMALPFFSYGGTNMLSTFFAVGTILSVGIHALPDRRRILSRVLLNRG